MVTKPSRSLFCKNIRRIIKKFKRKYVMNSDSVVDKETWRKIMQRAKDLLPNRIHEKASLLQSSSTSMNEKKCASEIAVLNTFKKFD